MYSCYTKTKISDVPTDIFRSSILTYLDNSEDLISLNFVRNVESSTCYGTWLRHKNTIVRALRILPTNQPTNRPHLSPTSVLIQCKCIGYSDWFLLYWRWFYAHNKNLTKVSFYLSKSLNESNPSRDNPFKSNFICSFTLPCCGLVECDTVTM